MFRPQNILERKSTLLSVVVFGVVGALSIPVILPHLFHGYHVFHILLHVGGISLAVFITVLSLLAYVKLKTKRLLITTIAFATFIAAESVVLVDATWPTIYDLGDVALLEVGHFLMILTLGLLATGVFRND